eukprot:gnl/MRDRNA2_/MRDRNA2_17122_c0_seq1.p1 gnl/MRDRNA2_/MRDRNA2_17122_c0~~gnl/MRDRNA2_/MRDRNA2_17122_c0_seq1.p1  ORF type:complete len:489 (-),score=84.84 gnl/MRDRNA2_/MRDRNA2_17122_c0_seq1:121-1587(-)
MQPNARPSWADALADANEVDLDDTVAIQDEGDVLALEGQGPPCTPHFYPDPNRRVLKEGDVMYFIRVPASFDVWRGVGCAVPGLDGEDSLKCLCDPLAFETRLQELGDLKAQAIEEQDADKDTVTAYVKKRKVDSFGRAVNTAGHETENHANFAPRMPPDVLNKVTKANDFLSFFGLPCNPHVERNALAIVTKRLRGELRSRISNAKKPRSPAHGENAAARIAAKHLLKASTEVAKYLVSCYNHPGSSLEDLLDHITTRGPECIVAIRDWLDSRELADFDDQDVDNIFADFQATLLRHAQLVEREPRKYLSKSQHKLHCTKVGIDAQSVLCGCYSGPPAYVAAQMKESDPLKAEQVRNTPHKCKDLRKDKKVTLVALLDSMMRLNPMPGPCDAFPEGYIFLSCEICQGKATDCNCTAWLDSVGITQREPFEFDLDEMVVPAHMDNYCFGQTPWTKGQGVCNLRRFTANAQDEGGVQIVGLSKEVKDHK